MFDKEKFIPEFYDKLSDSEKKEFDKAMLEDQLTDPLHIKGLPKPVRNLIKKAVKSSAEECIDDIKSKYEMRGSIMDNGNNKLSDEMMKKIYEAFRLDKKEKIDKFNQAVRKFISNETYLDDSILDEIKDNIEPIVKDNREPIVIVEGETITDDHNRRIVDPSIFKFRGKQVLHSYFDEPYPVMFPEDEKMMRGMSDEIKAKFKDYVVSNVGIPRETITIDSIPKLDTLTGCTQNFKQQQKYDMLEAMFNTLDVDNPDRNGRIWQKELLMKQLMKPMWVIPPRHHKSWMWMKLLQMQSYEIQQRILMNPPSTKWDINSVIHMRFTKQDLSKIKAHKWRYGKMWHSLEELAESLRLNENDSHIDSSVIDSLANNGKNILDEEKYTTPNRNNNKKALERVIKKARKHR